MSPSIDQAIRAQLRSVADPIDFIAKLLAHAPDAFAVWNRNGTPLLTNQAFHTLFAAVPPPDYNVLADDILEEIGMAPLIKRAFGGETVQMPTFWYDPRELKSVKIEHARRVAISVTLFPLFDKEGAVEYVVTTYKDETEIMLANERLRWSENRLRLAHQAADVGAFDFNAKTGITSWTPELEAIHGLKPGEFDGTLDGWRALLHPEDRDRALALSEHALSSTTSGLSEGVWRIVRPSGETRWIVARFQVRIGEDGTKHIFGVNIDITERRRRDATIRETEAQKLAVMEAALDAIVLMDHEGAVREWNVAAESTFGYGRDEAIGRSLADLIVPPELHQAHRAGLERYLKTGEDRILGRRVEVTAIKKDGTKFPAEVAIVPIRREGPPIFTGYIRDISERKRAAQAEIYERAKEAAEAANRELESLSHAVAHDLRAPLRALSGFSTILRQEHGDGLGSDAKDLLDRVIGNAKQMGEMLEQLLDLARLSKAPVHEEKVDLAQISESVIKGLRAADPARRVELVTHEGMVVRGDPKLLRTVLENLLSNAWKFTRDVAEARIEIGRMQDAANVDVYFVRDNGVGFDMKYRAKLFTAFQRLHRAEDFEGTGIGLASVARIAHSHGGRVWAEGAVGKGATFFFTLPGSPSLAPD